MTNVWLMGLTGCVVVGVLAWVAYLFLQKALTKLMEGLERLRGLESELRGQHQAVLSEKDRMLSAAESQGRTLQERKQELEGQISGINQSLATIRQEAVSKVSNLSEVIQPVIAMFRSPQIAGIEYAEAELDLLLKAHLGDGLYEQKPRLLASGNDIVDFIIKLPECMVPIDSKFPEATYRSWIEAPDDLEAKPRWRLFRDAVIRQLEATSKYIRPEVGTTEYALLFLPSDVIWHQAFAVGRWYGEENPIPRKSLEVRVFGCSTQTLIPLLNLLRLGLRNLKISEDIKGVQRQIQQLGTSFDRFIKDWGTLGTHLRNAYNAALEAEGAKGSLAALQRVIESLGGSKPEGSSLVSSEKISRE